METFSGKTALVTGASSGIGRAFVQLLASRGSNLIIVARSEDKLNALADELRHKGTNVHVFVCDLSERGATERLHEWTIEQNLIVDLLINNAGYGKWGEFTSFDRDTYNNMLQLNVNALTDLCHLFIPGMVERGGGGVINIGSTASFAPVSYSAVYGASKAYVLMLTEALYGEYSEAGIHVMALCPGGTATNFASVASSGNITGRDDYDTPELVAETGLDAFLAGKLTVITGGTRNKMAGFLPRVLSRTRVVKMIANGAKQRLGIS